MSSPFVLPPAPVGRGPATGEQGPLLGATRTLENLIQHLVLQMDYRAAMIRYLPVSDTWICAPTVYMGYVIVSEQNHQV